MFRGLDGWVGRSGSRAGGRGRGGELSQTGTRVEERRWDAARCRVVGLTKRRNTDLRRRH